MKIKISSNRRNKQQNSKTETRNDQMKDFFEFDEPVSMEEFLRETQD